MAVPVISLMEAFPVSTGAGGKTDRERWEPQIWTQSGREGAGRCKSMPGLARDLGVLVPWTVGRPAPAWVPPEHSCRQDCLGPWCLRALLCGGDLGDRVGLTPGLYVCPFPNLKCWPCPSVPHEGGGTWVWLRARPGPESSLGPEACSPGSSPIPPWGQQGGQQGAHHGWQLLARHPGVAQSWWLLTFPQFSHCRPDHCETAWQGVGVRSLGGLGGQDRRKGGGEGSYQGRKLVPCH